MTLITRRAALAGASALAAAGAEAAAPMAGKQAAGFYRHKLGDFELTLLTDGAGNFPMPEGFVKNVSRDQAIAAAAAAYMAPAGNITVPFNPLLVNTGAKLVLIDAGNGATPPGAPVGHLLANLQASGVSPEQVDVVILSHLHPDHINGVKNAQGGLAFPNAEIMAPAADWAFWMSDENAAKAANPMMTNYFAQVRKVLGDIGARITKYEPGKLIAPGITSIDAHGHTPGHCAFAIASGNARVLVQSDVTNIPSFFLRNPEWHVAFDVDPVMAVATRRRFHDMAVAEKALVLGYHFPFPNAGYVEKDGAGYRLVPIAWKATL